MGGLVVFIADEISGPDTAPVNAQASLAQRIPTSK